MNAFYFPLGNALSNFDLEAVKERCYLYGGNWNAWQFSMLNPIDNALAEIIYMNKTETPARIIQSLWKAKPKALCSRCQTWLHIEVRPMGPTLAQTFAVCPECTTAKPIQYPFAQVDFREWIDNGFTTQTHD